MRPFDLKYALAGCPVQTRDGHVVTLYRDRGVDSVHRLVTGYVGWSLAPRKWWANGRSLDGSTDFDLFLEEPPEFKVGDRVVVARKVTSAPHWTSVWVEAMDGLVGKHGIVDDVDSDSGVRVNFGEAYSWQFPLEALARAAATDKTERLRDEVVKEVIDVAAQVKEDAIREQLIELGWTPPEEQGPEPDYEAVARSIHTGLKANGTVVVYTPSFVQVVRDAMLKRRVGSAAKETSDEVMNLYKQIMVLQERVGRINETLTKTLDRAGRSEAAVQKPREALRQERMAVESTCFVPEKGLVTVGCTSEYTDHRLVRIPKKFHGKWVTIREYKGDEGV